MSSLRWAALHEWRRAFEALRYFMSPFILAEMARGCIAIITRICSERKRRRFARSTHHSPHSFAISRPACFYSLSKTHAST